MSNAGIPKTNRPAERQTRYYMVHSYHYDGDLVHSESTDLAKLSYRVICPLCTPNPDQK